RPIMLHKWRQRRWQHKVNNARPSSAELAAVAADFPVLAALGESERMRVGERAAEVLASKTFLGAGGFQPEYGHCLAVALLAARPVLNLGIGAYADFHTFILYPD